MLREERFSRSIGRRHQTRRLRIGLFRNPSPVSRSLMPLAALTNRASTQSYVQR
jgi:hypothetical protein